MVEQGGGRIIQIGSISGQRGNMGGIAYGASKAAVMHICKVLAVELSAQGVMVNAIAPGPIETGLSRHGPTRKQAYLDRIPTHSYGTVEAVASAALYLASDECDWVTGQILNVDGGYGACRCLPMIPPRFVEALNANGFHTNFPQSLRTGDSASPLPRVDAWRGGFAMQERLRGAAWRCSMPAAMPSMLAVATALALGAVEPWNSGLGGVGHAVVHRAGQARADISRFRADRAGGARSKRFNLDR